MSATATASPVMNSDRAISRFDRPSEATRATRSSLGSEGE